MNNPELGARQVTQERTHLVRAVAKLSYRERLRFAKALEVLAGGGGAVALAQAGLVLAGPGIFEALLARGWAVRHSNPAEVFKLAKAAVEVAARLHPRYGTRFVADLQARAWGELANAFRIAGRLEDAAQALAEAVRLSTRGSGNRLLWAWLLDLNATLLGSAGDLLLALESLALCRELYVEMGDRHLAGRALVTQAVFAMAAGSPAQALLFSQEGRALLDPEREPDLPKQATRNHRIFEVALRKATRLF